LGDGYYKLTAAHSGKVLDVAGKSTADGANIYQWGYGGGSNQQWKIEPLGNGYYRIVARHSGKCVDVSGVSTADGANIHQWNCHGGDNQAWKIERLN
jgi:alpha-amylase